MAHEQASTPPCLSQASFRFLLQEQSVSLHPQIQQEEEVKSQGGQADSTKSGCQ